MSIVPNFSLIKSGAQFENLVAAYFHSLKNSPESGYGIYDVQGPSVGPDGGKDILVKFRMNDGINEQYWDWVIQCKKSIRTIGLKSIADSNIPSLIHSLGAIGYLLVCSNDVSSSLQTKFEELNRNCRFHYKYKYWIGAEFQRKLSELGDERLLQSYFIKKKGKK